MELFSIRIQRTFQLVSTGKSKLKWAEDLRMYKSHGIKPISALKGKILSKIPQFIEARLPWSEIPEAEEESLIQPDAANKKE